MAITGEGAADTVEDGGGRNAVSSRWLSQRIDQEFELRRSSSTSRSNLGLM